MRKVIALVALMWWLPLYAQNAKVIELSPEDAAKALHLQGQLDAAQKAVSDFRDEVKARYTHEQHDKPWLSHDCDLPAGWTVDLDYRHCPAFKAGWENGFQYSGDYRFIVSIPAPTTPHTYDYRQCEGCVWWGNWENATPTIKVW